MDLSTLHRNWQSRVFAPPGVGNVTFFYYMFGKKWLLSNFWERKMKFPTSGLPQEKYFWLPSETLTIRKFPPPLQKIILAPKPVARFKSLGANTYLGGEENLWANNLRVIAPEFPPLLTTFRQYIFAVTLNIFTHTFTKLVFTRQHHTKNIFTGAVPVNNFRKEENIARSQTLCLY